MVVEAKEDVLAILAEKGVGEFKGGGGVSNGGTSSLELC